MRYFIQTLPAEGLYSNLWQTIDSFEDPSVAMEHIESPVHAYDDYTLVRCVNTDDDTIYVGIHHDEILHNITFGSELVIRYGFHRDARSDNEAFNRDYATAWQRCSSASAMLDSLRKYAPKEFVVNALADTANILIIQRMNENPISQDIKNVKFYIQHVYPSVSYQIERVVAEIEDLNSRREDTTLHEFVYELYQCIYNTDYCERAMSILCLGMADGNSLEARNIEADAADILRGGINFQDIAKMLCRIDDTNSDIAR